jgi:hypothetical protein
MADESASDAIGPVRRRGRPSVALVVSQLPATTVPAGWHDAVAREAIRRDVSVAQVVRDAVFSHLKNSGVAGVTSE